MVAERGTVAERGLVGERSMAADEQGATVKEVLVDENAEPRHGTSCGERAAWQRVVATWDDPAAHAAYLGECHDAADLARAAGNYRAYLDDSDRKAVAEAQLKRIASAAMARLEVTRAVQRVAPSRPYGKILLIATFLLGTLLLLSLL